MNLLSAPSPNFHERRSGMRVDTVLLHHTGAPDSGRGALAWLCSPESKVSAHYLVAKDGTVFSLVPEEKAAWHAGLGRFPWEDRLCPPYDFNQRSVGIEVANVGDGQDSFTEAQYQALAELVPAIISRMCQGAPKPVLVRSADGWSHVPGGTVTSASGKMTAYYTGPAQAYVAGHRDIAMPQGRKTDPADNFDWGRVRAALARSNVS